MEDLNKQNQPLSSLPGTPPTIVSPNTENISWVPKKKSKLKYVLAGLFALILVGGTAFGAYYFSRNLNRADVPNAPTSKPQAAAGKNLGVGAKNSIDLNGKNCPKGCGSNEYCDNGNCRRVGGAADERTDGQVRMAGQTTTQVAEGKADIAANKANVDVAPQNTCAASMPTALTVTKISPTSVKVSWTPGVGTYVKLWVSTNPDPTGDCGRLGTKTIDATCRVNEGGSLANGDPYHADILASTASYTITGLTPSTTYYYRMMSWIVSGCDNAAPIISFITDPPACVDTTWTPDPALTCVGKNVTQTSNCGTTRTSPGTKVPSWSPAVDTKCLDVSFIQTSNCDATRSAVGTKTTGDCACVDTTWTPNANTVCSDETLTQTSNCGTKKDVDGTKNCGVANISVEKLAYADETTNKSGEYDLNELLDTISKEQTFVYAFEITNDGTNIAQDIVVTDVLKGDNRELLTYVDGDSRCKYVTSTRTVTCSGMDLDADETDTYAFRVKVSNAAINGDTIFNDAILTYKDMPTDGEVSSELELTISTVVGCNHVCTTDDECSTGLTCDTDTNKCRKPSCVTASSCNCAVTRAATAVPTRRVTAETVQPTVLPETGILDFPGVATFGGGLLLAIVGILLAL